MDHHYRKLENMYHGAPINRFFEPRLTISRGAAEVRVVARAAFHHAASAVHGSVYFKMLDDAAFFAVSSLIEDVFALTSSFHVHLLRPVVEGPMVARGAVVHEGKSAFVADAVLVDDAGVELGRGTGSFVRSKVKLVPEMGYAIGG
jgi:uncharacterized protein (TIGR00369 family)